jgi:hypothetical protein
MEYFGKLQIDNRKIERSPQYLDDLGRTSTITDSKYAQSDEVQATNDFKLKPFAFSTKSTNITAKYTQTDRKKTKRSDTKQKHNKKKTIPTKLDLQR